MPGGLKAEYGRFDDQCNPRVWSLFGQPSIAPVIDGGGLQSGCSLYGWIGLESEASSLAAGGGEFQDLVKAWIAIARAKTSLNVTQALPEGGSTCTD